MTVAKRPCVVFYVQHLLGVGHVRRASLIARAVAERNADCHVLLGGPEVPGCDWGHAHCHPLPSIAVADAGFSGYVTESGDEPDDAYWALRQDRICTLIGHVKPHALLIEQYPFGRRPFRHEIGALIATTRIERADTRVLCSVRDILVGQRKPERLRETVETIKRDFDRVLVHGDPEFISLGETFPLAKEIDDLIAYTGYVTGVSSATTTERRHGGVVVAAGGGAVGADLMAVAMRARQNGLMADRPWLFLSGPNLDPAVVDTLRRTAPEGVSIEPNRPDYPALLRSANLSISQAGYNTVMDLMIARVPALVVPFAEGHETEQTFRARRLAELGYLVLLEAEHATPGTLSDAACAATATTIPAMPPFRTNGAVRTADLVLETIQPEP